MPDQTPRPERIWIMGASDGIGADVARLYSARGAQVILSARRAEALEKVAQDCTGAQIIPADVADRASLVAAADRIKQDGPLDRAITLAAIYDPAKVMQADPEQAAKIVSVNLMGAFNFAQIANDLLRQGGQLALTGSVAGYVGLPQGQIYSATKAGVINLAESLRAELSETRDVRVINPGFVDTSMTQKNDFDMPFIIRTDQAAVAILRGLDGRRFEVHFPKRLTLLTKFLRALPYWAALAITKRLVR